MIAQKHEIPLTTAINTSQPGRGALVQALYMECQNVFSNIPSKTNSVTKQRTVNTAKNGTHVTAIVTDDNSGLFVQLTATLDSNENVVDGPFLTFGKKFLEESKNAQLSNTAVRLWR